MNKYLYSIISLLAFIYALPAKAVCPVCTVAVTAGVGLSRWLGIDDSISGIWIGGMTLSVAIWTINWINSKKYNFKGDKLVTILGYYLLIYFSLYFGKMLGHPENTLLGIDKLIFGTIIGTASFFSMVKSYEYLKAKNNNKPHFPYQKVAMPVGGLTLISIIFYFITR